MNKYEKFFTNDEDTIRIKLEAKQWVEIKSLMSIGDWERYNGSMVSIQQNDNRAQRRAAGIRGGASKNSGDTVGKIAAGWLELLYINIVSWSFEGITLNKDNISKLKPEFTDIIIESINSANPRSPLAATSLLQGQE